MEKIALECVDFKVKCFHKMPPQNYIYTEAETSHVKVVSLPLWTSQV